MPCRSDPVSSASSRLRSRVFPPASDTRPRLSLFALILALHSALRSEPLQIEGGCLATLGKLFVPLNVAKQYIDAKEKQSAYMAAVYSRGKYVVT